MPRSWTLSPSADLDEAITFFRKRLAISSKQFEAMAESANKTGFWMARVATAQRARRIQDSLEIAFANGMDFDTWRRTNRGILQRIPKAHLETTFRNWTQTSMNQARVNYLSNPQVKKRRPFWVFDAVIDAVTTPVCMAYNGTVLPAGHKWFKAHTPPLHHNCRSSIRGLTKYQAEQIGVRKRAPANRLTKAKAEAAGLKPGKVKPASGFGKVTIKPWAPTTRDLPTGFKAPKRPTLSPFDAAIIAGATVAAAKREEESSKVVD